MVSGFCFFNSGTLSNTVCDGTVSVLPILARCLASFFRLFVKYNAILSKKLDKGVSDVVNLQDNMHSGLSREGVQTSAKIPQ